jgi:hypothetical protein
MSFLVYEDHPFLISISYLLASPAVASLAGLAGVEVAAVDVAAPAGADGAAAPGLVNLLTPTAPPFLPEVLVCCPLTFSPNMCL